MAVALAPLQTAWTVGSTVRRIDARARERVPGRGGTSAGRAERGVPNRSIVAWPAARHDERNLDTTGNHHR
jgi:hypothetical protein